MTQGFDEWYGKGEAFYYRENDDKYVSRVSYKACAASRQAEIDQLKQRITMLEIDVHIRDKMIDDALDYVFGLYCTGDLDTERLENILKGESNE